MIQRILAAGVPALLAALLAFAAPALAAPTIAISAPGQGATLNERHPAIVGTTTDSADPVEVTVYRGSTQVFSESVQPQALGGEWSVEVASELPDSSYRAVVAQTEGLTGEAGEASVEFSVHASKPQLTLDGISSPTGDRTPSFTGTASEGTPVTVYVYSGSSAGGPVVAEAQASGGGSWSTGALSSELDDGTYTAVAEQESEFGDGPGRSGEIHFTVHTPPPSVTLNGIETPSNDTTPSFTGSASEKTKVIVYVYKGSSAEGSPVAEAEATGTGGSWSSGAVSHELGEGVYTAVAKQGGAFGNGTGVSQEIHFAVVTASPHVTLNPVESPSGNTTPSFTGTASEANRAVSISIYVGTSASGPVVSSASATGTGGSFVSGHASPELADGTYTARAVQSSSLGNPQGESNTVTFTIDTSSPVVTLDAVPTPSNDTSPTFSGTATDTTQVVVRVFHGSEQVASASGSPSAGSWTSGGLSKSLSSGSYTAIAEQESSLGNAPGKSAPIGFTVDTSSPQVTLNQPAPKSGNQTPSFSGTASDSTPVTVEVRKGGSLVTTVEAGVPSGGSWSSPAVSVALGEGTYTAVAIQPSSLGNAEGRSEARTFTIDTSAPTLTIVHPQSPSSDRSPSFSGTTTEEEAPVKVHVLEAGHQIAELIAAPSGGAWSTESLGSPLAAGTHDYEVYAEQRSAIDGETGRSEEVPFVVDTTSPVVTLDKVKTPSSNGAPTFHGTASDTSTVTVEVFAGASASGTPVAAASASPGAGGEWTSGAASPGLASGTYTAVAVQQSSLGNPAGRSGEVTFVVDTNPPSVTIVPLVTPTANRAPRFSGTASDTKPVVVHVFESGLQVASAEATPSGGRWETGPVKPELPLGDRSYTAYATEVSSLDNPEGRSAELSFVVDTNPPTVTIEPVATPSSNTTPTFSGTATDVGPVKVVVKGGGKQYETSVPVSAGKWTAGIALPPVKTTYTAVAIQASSIGNPAGETKPPIEFVVDPSAPNVSMAPVPAQIGAPKPVFSGTAADTTPVTVSICKISTVPCEAEHGEWSARSTGGGSWVATEEASLPDGEYQAVASERTLAGAVGATPRQLFTIDTSAPAVTIEAPGQGATVSGPTVAFHGAAGTARHDVQAVTLQLFAGSSATGSPLQTVTVDAAGGGWSATLGGVSPGNYVARVSQSDEAGNVGASLRSFTDTTAAAPTAGPTAAFTWYPAHPHTGEQVTLVSGATDAVSPITSYAWNTSGSAFAAGGQSRTTTFDTPGHHQVQLRVTDGAGLSSVASEQIPVTYPLLAPFPLVRIVTTGTRGRVRLTLLSVQAPVGAVITVSCIGKACPLRSESHAVKSRTKGARTVTIAFRGFERSLSPGVVLQIRVVAAGKIGKYTRFAIRRGRLPLRSDACVSSTEPRPVSCPG